MKLRGLIWFPVLIAVLGSCTCVLAEEGSAEKHVAMYLKNTEPRVVASMKHQGSFDDIPAVVGKLVDAVEKGDHLQAGPVMIVYFNSPQNVPESELSWEVLIPVVSPGSLAGNENDKVGFKVFESMYVAYTYHVGPYEKVGDTYAQAFDWIEKNNYPLAGFPVEVYWSDDKTTPKDKLVTEIWLPVKEREKPAIMR
jgi:AraC family transcriptional regulator